MRRAFVVAVVAFGVFALGAPYFGVGLAGGVIAQSSAAPSWTGTEPATATMFPVSFTEHGLPEGTYWSVSLNETSYSSPSSTISLEEPNGSYSFYTWDVQGYVSYANTTLVNVTGTPIQVTVYYNPPTPGTYFVTFVQTGLPYNIFWTVQLSAIINGSAEPGGIGQGNSGPTHTPAGGLSALENGSFAWTAFHPSTNEWPIPAYYPFPSNGTVKINGSSLLIYLTYRYSYPFSFLVTGLASGATFSLQIPDETVTGTGDAYYLVMIPNGTWDWVANAPGYQPQNGSVNVSGMPQSNVRSVTFEALPGSPESLPWSWIGVGVVSVVAAAIAVLLLARRRRDRATAFAPGPAPQVRNDPPS